MQVDSQSLSLRDKTSKAVTSKGRYEVVDDKGALCTPIPRRCITRGLANANAAAAESVMLQVQQQEEFLKSKEEKRLREQERHEAEEASQKEVEEWERNLLALFAPTSMETMWEIPAIGHFLCLAQQILNLPEIVFYELERCLLMPQCNVFLSKIMTSLLSPPHRRPTLHRRPSLPYQEWETALRQRVQQWYTMVGQAENPDRCAEKLGLCSQFFKVLGEVSPLEKKAFHELPFYQKVWLLKGLCDVVYETQSEVQDAVLGQPIHECREVILGYDAQENAYIHFPQFCGADVRVYKQRPFRAPEFPVPPVQVKRAFKTRLERTKCKISNKCNGDIRPAKKVLPEIYRGSIQSCESQENCHEKPQVENCSSSTVQDIKIICETHQPCNTIETVCCKENVEKSISPEAVYGEPLSPGEIRVLEDVDKYGEAAIGKLEFSPLKENALKACQIHVNKNHTDSTDVICHQVAMDIILDSSLHNHKKLKLSRIRAKKKKKKKKKFKDTLNDHLQLKCDSLQLHKFRSLKTEINSKLYFTKKRAKHKKHKTGNNTVSKKAVTKKRKTANSPTTPEFQLVCTNLDELRELIKKIEGELKELETNKKKSEKWYFRRQGVKELHSTLVRLLNELLPWEPKLQKAFQKHRARLKKDFDDFKKLPENKNFTREHGSCEENEASKSSSSMTSTTAICHQIILRNDKLDSPKLKEMDTPKKESLIRYTSTQKTSKRHCRSSMSPGAEAKVFVPGKKVKLSAQVDSLHCTEVAQTCCSLKDKKVELEGQHISKDTICASVTDSIKGTKPIQALLAKNTGNKVTLTNHQVQSTDKTTPAGETSAISPTQSVQTKPLLTGQATSKNPLQMIYKLPDGQCIPIDLHNSTVKIQVQPMTDSKTGEKIMQQVLFLPKNLYIQHKEAKANTNASQQVQSNTGGQLCISNETPIPPKSFAFQEKIELTPSLHSTNMAHFKKHSSPAIAPETVISTPDRNVFESQCDKGTAKNPVLGTLQASLRQSGTLLSVLSDMTKAPQTKDIASHTLNLSPTLPRELSDSKQELKTVCIRDSQSILVRTRGGNTGVVKVQTSQDHSTNPNAVFSFTPQLQSFLGSKVKTSSSSTLASVPSPLPGFYSSSEYSRISSESVSGGPNQLSGTNTKLTQRQNSNTGYICKVSDNLQPSNLLPAVSSANSWLPSNSWGNIDAATSISNLSHDGPSPGRNSVPVSATDIKQTEPKMSKISVVQPDSTTSRGEPVNVPNLQKVMLVQSPSVLTPGNATNMNFSTTQTSCSGPAQKFVFLNTQVPTGLPRTTISMQSAKQTVPSFVGKTHGKMSEQPQIILIPSTLGTPVKMSSTPIVSQIKDVKIGLTIGQTIVNTGHAAKNMLPVNIFQNTLTKGRESILQKNAISNVTNLIPCPENAGRIVGQNSDYDCTGTTAKWPAGCAVESSINSVVAHSSSTDQNNSYAPALTNRLSSTNISNTVAISTVKTGHLSSSVLLSTTQMAGQVKSTLSSFRIPGSPTFSTSCEPSNATPPISSACQPLSNLTTQTYSKTLSTNACTSQGSQTPTTVTKPRSDSLFSQGSTGPLQISSALPKTQLFGQLNDSCFQQKIVINTSTPLAPGTQITINGTRFIVPPQGLGVGSHVLVISPSTKHDVSSVGNSRQTSHGLGSNNITEQQMTLKQNMPLTHGLNKPLTISKNMTSFGTTHLLPAIQASTLNMMSKGSTQLPGPPSTCPQITNALKPLLVSALQQSRSSQPSNPLMLPADTTIKDSVVLKTIMPPSVLSDSKNADLSFVAYQPSVPDTSRTIAL
ncbi:uncharacterized protein KIAA2026 [Xenopus laevis]|uniref:Uncharacterized protein KIAA2026 n=2 Tax=Xenopus laevis TaxID=8355 RepID=A0A1L8HP27_XENLA|nr:uncharacterized protein KIAA2026 [Xenopus laevis]OCT97843.1 hypothetical protein XELAEV_18010075mg [Xenopus laevis]